MGQKVSPISFRIGITQSWRSRWYATKKEYGKYAVEDEKIRKFVKKEYSFAGIPKIEIERTREKTRVIVHAARPGVIIGRRGTKVDQLSEDLAGVIGSPVDLRVIEVEKPELSAQLIGESIAEQLEKRSPYRRTLRRATETVMNSGAQGIKIQIAGRIGGIEIARREKIIVGRMPLHTLRADIDYGCATAFTSKGTVGVKVWIFKGEILPKKEKLTHVPDAQTGKVSEEPARPAKGQGDPGK